MKQEKANTLYQKVTQQKTDIAELRAQLASDKLFIRNIALFGIAVNVGWDWFISVMAVVVPSTVGQVRNNPEFGWGQVAILTMCLLVFAYSRRGK